MSAVDSVTALSGYQVQSQNLASQIQSLQTQLSTLKSTTIPYDQQQLNNYNQKYPYIDPEASDSYPTSIYTLGSQLGLQLSNDTNQISSINSQISSLQSQKTNLDQIIAQLQGNITTYVTPHSTTNPSTTSDTAHNIANTLSNGLASAESFLGSVPKTDLYIGLGVVFLFFLLN